MKTKNIFKTLALAMLMPTMLLTTACSSEDDVVNNTANTENTINKGYALPVTVNVTREGDAATRATYNESTKNLEFSTGDKLFVEGKYATGSKSFAGALDYVSEGTFSGTIYAQDNTYSTYDALLTAASSVKATLLPNSYVSTGFISIDDNSTPVEYDDVISATPATAFVASGTAKATGVEQLSLEQASTYNSGFALAPQNAILNFTITGLAASTSVNVSLTSIAYNITGTVTTDASGTATFAAGIMGGLNLQPFSLTVGGKNITIVSSDKVVEEGKIYNITRGAPSLVDAFVNGNTTIIKFTQGTLSATYTTGSGFGTVTIEGNKLQTLLSSATMTKDGNNLVVEVVTNSIPAPPITLPSETGSLTINTVNNTYSWSWSKPGVGDEITLSGITIGGNDITPLPTPAS